MKRVLLVLLVVFTMMAFFAIPVMADPTDYDKKVEKGIYYLVAKDSNWNPLPRNTNPFGMGKFSIENDMLTMHLVCHKLTPGNWYYVEIVDKTGGWNPFNDDRYSRFYAQADEYGDVDITFSWSIAGHSNIEVNLKNADWVALLDPSDYGNEDGDWIYTGQGWDYVLYGATTIRPLSP